MTRSHLFGSAIVVCVFATLLAARVPRSVPSPGGNPLSSTDNAAHAAITIDRPGVLSTHFNGVPAAERPTDARSQAVEMRTPASRRLSVGMKSDAADLTPKIAAPIRVVATVGQPVTIIVIASDFGPETLENLTAETSGFVAGFTTNAAHSQGTLIWTPGADDVGVEHRVTFTVSGARSASVITMITVGQSLTEPPITIENPIVTICDEEDMAFNAADPE
jgi:hypothetical protein